MVRYQHYGDISPDGTYDVVGPWEVWRLVFEVYDESGNSTPNTFGNMARLTNGIVIQHIKAGGVFESFPIVRQNSEWCWLAGPDGWSVQGSKFYCVRISFWKFGGPIKLMTDQDALRIITNDNIDASMDSLTAVAHGKDIVQGTI